MEVPTKGVAMDDIKTKATIFLKDYVSQMRTAGFPDYLIKKKILETGSITIPNSLPENFGSSTWSGGLMKELQKDVYKKGNWVDIIPTPNNYMEYMPGYSPSRIPTYKEFAGRTQPMGQFEQTRSTNLMTALQNRLKGYSGPKVGASQAAYEMGIVGLPQELGQQYYQEFLTLAQTKADEQKKQEQYEDLVMQYPEIAFTPGASVEENAEKIAQYNDLMKQQTPGLSDVTQMLNDAVYQATIAGEPVSMEDVMNAALMMNIKLSYDEASAIFNSAKNQALKDMGK